MYQKSTVSWIKHLDFEIIDILCMEFSFCLSYILRHENVLGYENELYFRMGIDLLIINIVVMFFMQSYKGILIRNKWQECTATFRHMTTVYVIFLLYIYFEKTADSLSRTVYFLSWIISLLTCYFGRVVWKKNVRKNIKEKQQKNKLLILALEDDIEHCIENLYEKEYREFEIIGIGCLEPKDNINGVVQGISVILGKEAIIEYIRQEVVDEVLIDGFQSQEELCEWVDIFLSMGITVHISMGFLPNHLPNKYIEKMGSSYVVTSSVKMAESWELVCKRLMDIVGGIVGILLTGIVFIFVAPAIKITSPGPIFFKQVRVGKNGRVFHIYKFRSMYMDAEERKKELMKYNEMQGLMFKIENDPRIIGSEKGPGKGIGNFIRKTSIDELPQFWNILKGDMSLVGTRPPTVSEYEQYELHHKIRLSMKPGLTGMWQTSGRSEITDFEEVVRLDTEYIENWSIKLDIKLILKTIKVVFDRTGSK